MSQQNLVVPTSSGWGWVTTIKFTVEPPLRALRHINHNVDFFEGELTQSTKFAIGRLNVWIKWFTWLLHDRYAERDSLSRRRSQAKAYGALYNSPQFCSIRSAFNMFHKHIISQSAQLTQHSITTGSQVGFLMAESTRLESDLFTTVEIMVPLMEFVNGVLEARDEGMHYDPWTFLPTSTDFFEESQTTPTPLPLTESSRSCLICLSDFFDVDDEIDHNVLDLFSELPFPVNDPPQHEPCTLPCDHVVAPDCLMTWFENGNTCPACRRPLVKPVSQRELELKRARKEFNELTHHQKSRVFEIANPTDHFPIYPMIMLHDFRAITIIQARRMNIPEVLDHDNTKNLIAWFAGLLDSIGAWEQDRPGVAHTIPFAQFWDYLIQRQFFSSEESRYKKFTAMCFYYWRNHYYEALHCQSERVWGASEQAWEEIDWPEDELLPLWTDIIGV
ncbi:hypothetical protein EJ08DRAFT_696167 [Tothia fuscella]|uniref:RING-type domain-containing protein n=1 Tax=Tothia fuscella TaxID=1048955 RepID=A0A9P4NU39_9PEZI|nr:hypothetical protein EJ08DRAFT_696167 [Tothia fuscella]